MKQHLFYRMTQRFAVVLTMSPLWLHAAPLTLSEAEQQALVNDPMVQAHQASAAAMRQQAIAADTLPDPKIKLGLMSFPTDSFKRDQEPMTQTQIGIQQMFPRGDSLAIKSRRVGLLADGQTARAMNQQRQVRRQVRQAWLELFYWQQAEQVVTKNRRLFERLVNITQSQYATGRHKQQDVVRAQLELGVLDDRLSKIRTMQDKARAQLAKWVGEALAGQPVESQLPVLVGIADKQTIAAQLDAHPMLQMEQAMLDASEQGVALARQGYKPSWMVDVTYGLRDGNNSNGTERADFLSAMLVFDVPLFTGNRQDKQLAASQARRQASLLKREDRRRELKRQLDDAYAVWQRLGERIEHYQRLLLPKSRENAKASLHAYQSDRGDFTMLMRAQITELETHLKTLRLQVDRTKAQAKLLYLAGEPS